MYIFSFFFKRYGHHRDQHVPTHPFPTRRSSDLPALPEGAHRVGMRMSARPPRLTCVDWGPTRRLRSSTGTALRMTVPYKASIFRRFRSRRWIESRSSQTAPPHFMAPTRSLASPMFFKSEERRGGTGWGSKVKHRLG